MNVNKAYVDAQLSSALAAGIQSETPAERQRAGERVRKWLGVLRGTESGTLRIGSRTPVISWPAWVTPEVVRGGFATGFSAAGGQLESWERELAEQVGAHPSRVGLNAHFLGEQGQSHLKELNESGGYVLDVPENGALKRPRFSAAPMRVAALG